VDAWVFVYGTLRSGQRNHHVAARAGLREARPAVALGLDLYHLEPEGYPAVVEGGGSVAGELLQLRGGLSRLDRLEGVDRPEPRYRRALWRVEAQGGERISAWLYLYLLQDRLTSGGAIRVAGGDWVTWRNTFDS
jgi:gamma-glutamylcyclotransferase (GGCT)/AIG2-like uncharacterized protein YtfP